MRTITIASDHAGFSLKHALISFLKELGYQVEDVGTENANVSVDYPDYGFKAVKAVLEGKSVFAIIICGTGIGMSILANRFKGVRAALCHNEFEAEVARKHNNANILCLGGRVLGEEIAKRCVKVFLTTHFEGDRHQRRLEKIDTYAEKER